MADHSPDVIANAARLGEDVQDEAAREGMPAAWRALDHAIEQYELSTGGTVEELLPPGAGHLAFRLPGAERARDFTRRIICNRREKLRPLVQGSVTVGVRGLALALMTELDLPDEGANIAGVYAGVLMTYSLTDLCEGAPKEPDAA